MSMLTELSRSPDGERLIVGNPFDHEYREPDDAEATKVNVDSIATLLGASGASAADPSRAVASSLSQRDQAFLSEQRQEQRGEDDRRVGADNESRYSSSGGVPLVPLRHVGLLRGGRGGGGGGGALIGNLEKAFLDDGDDEEQGATTVAAVAAAAFAGGWFSALLAVATMACWSELSGNRGEGEGGWWRAGGAWLVRVFTYGQ